MISEFLQGYLIETFWVIAVLIMFQWAAYYFIKAYKERTEVMLGALKLDIKKYEIELSKERE
jgi:hypothetical protein